MVGMGSVGTRVEVADGLAFAGVIPVSITIIIVVVIIILPKVELLTKLVILGSICDGTDLFLRSYRLGLLCDSLRNLSILKCGVRISGIGQGVYLLIGILSVGVEWVLGDMDLHLHLLVQSNSGHLISLDSSLPEILACILAELVEGSDVP